MTLMIFFITATVNAIFGPFFYKKAIVNETQESLTSKNYPFVSVLVPARNEEHNIEKCLNSLINQDYPNYEIIVIDDNSNDDTYKIAKKFSNIYEKVKVIKGKALPKEWLGKNWACHQLFEQSNGEYLVYKK